MKKEWLCHDVQAAYLNTGSNPKDISKNHYGLGLIPCSSGCKSKVQVVDSELQLRKSKVSEVKSFNHQTKTFLLLWSCVWFLAFDVPSKL